MVLQRDTLGVTRVMDLSKADTERVRALALIELTALFDTNGITYTRHKSKKRLKGKNMGVILYCYLLPTGGEEREVLGVGTFPVAILPSCQDMRTIAL